MVNIARSMDPLVEGDSSNEDNQSSPSFLQDRQNLLQQVVGERRKAVGYLPTVWVASVLLALSLGLGVFVIVLAVSLPKNKGHQCDTFYFTLYARAIYWVCSLFCDVYLRRKHVEARIMGYLDFYKEIMKIVRLPHYVINVSNLILLTLTSVMHQQYGDFPAQCMENLLNPINVLATLIVIEAVIVSSLLIIYIVKVKKFNLLKSPPDALCDEWMASFIRDSYSAGEIGYRETENQLSDLLEKQADFIRNLKEQNERLLQKVMIISMQLQEKHSASIA